MTKWVSVRTRRVGAVLLSLLLAVGTIPLFGVSADTAVDRLGWQLNDDNGNDMTLELATDGAHGGVLKATVVGDTSSGKWVTVGTKDIAVEGGMRYRFSIDLKGTGTVRRYKLTGFSFDQTGTPKEIAYEMLTGAVETQLSEDWQSLSAAFTAPADAVRVQIRLVFFGAQGDTMLLDNASLCPVKKTPTWDFSKPDGYYLGWKKADAGYNNPDIDSCRIGWVDMGRDSGAISFHREYGVATPSQSFNTSYMLTDCTTVGHTYVVQLWVKGTVRDGGADALDLHFGWTFAQWEGHVDGDDTKVYFPGAVYDDWTQLTFKYTVTAGGWTPLMIAAGGYAGVDCLIDNVSIYDESDLNKTNLITGGDFYVSEPDTTQELIVNGGFEVAQHTVTLDGVAYKTVYDGDTLDLSAETPVKDGAWFKGYYTDADCTKPFTNGSAITADTALYSGWITVEQQPQVEAVQVRLVGEEGLRFVSRISRTAVEELEALDGAAEIGTIVAPKAKVTGAFDLSGVDGKYIKKVPAVNRLQAGQDYDEDGTVKFTAVVIQIPEKNYASDIAARTYVTYTDASGIQRSYYSSESTSEYYATNLAETAQATLDQHGDTLTETEKTRLEAIVAVTAA